LDIEWQMFSCLRALEASKNDHGEEPWILRATINSERFDAIARTSLQGSSGNARQTLTNREILA
jgi:hypothetical protein